MAPAGVQEKCFATLCVRRNAMPIPSICLDGRLRQFVDAFGACWSRPQKRHFVTVLLGLLQSDEPRTLSGLRRQVAGGPSVASLSRFLARAPWSVEAVVQTWWQRFAAQLAPAVEAERQRQQANRPKRRGRPPPPVVTGYLIGDDSTLAKPKGRKMAGIGRHYSTTAGRQIVGHSLVQGLYVLLGRRCPLAPWLYRQQAVCAAEGVPFASKIDRMAEVLATFAPLPGTQTHVLLDSWYSAKRLWKVARARGFAITTGLKKNRALRLEDPTAERGWRWQRLDEYAATLSAEAYRQVIWPNQAAESDEPRWVLVHVVPTRVRKLYCCQVLIVRESLASPPRFWASSDLAADLAELLRHVGARWTIEVLFGETKDLLGLDQYQVLSATALLRFWTLVLAAYVFLEEEGERLQRQTGTPVSLGQARRAVQARHQEALVHWICDQRDHGRSAADINAALAA
jgi:hypothetical protein